MDYPFILLTVSFKEQNILISTKANLLIFFLLWIILYTSQEITVYQCHKDFPLCFLLQVLVLGLTFRTMIIFNYLHIVVRYGLKFIFCLWWSKCTNTFFYQIFFFHQIAFAPCWKWADGICADVFLDLLFYWVDLLVCLYAAPHHLNYKGFKIVWVRQQVLQFCSLLKLFWLSKSSEFPFSDQLLNFSKNLLAFWLRLHWIYRWIWGELTS